MKTKRTEIRLAEGVKMDSTVNKTIKALKKLIEKGSHTIIIAL